MLAENQPLIRPGTAPHIAIARALSPLCSSPHNSEPCEGQTWHVHPAMPALLPLVTIMALIAPAERWHPVLDPPVRIVRAFQLGENQYQAGHRGADLRAAQGKPVFAPAAGTVTFVGQVVDRGVMTIELQDGTLISVEPVVSDLVAGDTVAAGQQMAIVQGATHCGWACLHIGARKNDRYVNPSRALLSGQKPRLLPLHAHNGASSSTVSY